MPETGLIGEPWRIGAPPGVYERRVRAPIVQDVRLDVAAFVGLCERGPVGVATVIDAWTTFLAVFGRPGGGRQLPQCVQQFFANGGRRCVVVRVAGEATHTQWTLPGLQWEPVDGWSPRSPQGEFVDGFHPVLVEARQPGAWGDRLVLTLRIYTAPLATPLYFTTTSQRAAPDRTGSTPPLGALLRSVWNNASSNALPERKERLYFVEAPPPGEASGEPGSVWLSGPSVYVLAPTDLPTRRQSLREEVLIDLQVSIDEVVERWTGLGFDPAHPRYLPSQLTSSALLRMAEPDASHRLWPDPRADLQTPNPAPSLPTLTPTPWGTFPQVLPIVQPDPPQPPEPTLTFAHALPAGKLVPILPTVPGTDAAATFSRSDQFPEADGTPIVPTTLDDYDDHHETEPIALLCYPDLVHAQRNTGDAPDVQISTTWGPRFNDCDVPPAEVLPPPGVPHLWPELNLDGIGDPDDTSEPTLAWAQLQVIAEAERRRCTALLDLPPGAGSDFVSRWRTVMSSERAAAYAPWLLTAPAEAPLAPLRLFPPVGAIAGLIAATEARGGPAAIPANRQVAGITGLDLDPLLPDAGFLHEERINLIRPTERGPTLLGARTLSQDVEWTWLSHRRLFDWLGRQLVLDTRWAVFEPSNPALWRRLELTAERRLKSLFDRGVLVGTKPEEGFFVRCDASTNPQHDLDEGRTIVLVGAAPAAPAEFIVFQLSLLRDGSASLEPTHG